MGYLWVGPVERRVAGCVKWLSTEGLIYKEIKVQDVIEKVLVDRDLVVVNRKGKLTIGVYRADGNGLVIFEASEGKAGRYKDIYKIYNPTERELDLYIAILKDNNMVPEY